MTEDAKTLPAAGLAPADRSPTRKSARKPSTKSDMVIALLRRPRGATLDEMMKATGWQAHSVRGFLAGSLKKKLGQAVMAEKSDKGRVYRLDVEAR